MLVLFFGIHIAKCISVYLIIGGDVTSKMNTGVFEALSDCYQSHNGWDGVIDIVILVHILLPMETGSDTRLDI